MAKISSVRELLRCPVFNKLTPVFEATLVFWSQEYCLQLHASPSQVCAPFILEVLLFWYLYILEQNSASLCKTSSLFCFSLQILYHVTWRFIYLCKFFSIFSSLGNYLLSWQVNNNNDTKGGDGATSREIVFYKNELCFISFFPHAMFSPFICLFQLAQ